MVSRAALPIMKQKFGRIIIVASAPAMFGNVGQTNYSAARLKLLCVRNTIATEGQKYNIHCSNITPISGIRKRESIPLPDRRRYVVCHSSREAVVPGAAVRDHLVIISKFTQSHHRMSGQETTAGTTEAVQDLDAKTGDKKYNSAATPSPPSITPAITALTDLLGAKLQVMTAYGPKDLIIYALGVGVSLRDKDGLKFLYEGHENFSAIPTYCAAQAQAAVMKLARRYESLGWFADINKMRLGEAYVELLKPIPSSTTFSTEAEVVDVLDKGFAAIILVNSGYVDIIETDCASDAEDVKRTEDNLESASLFHEIAKKVVDTTGLTKNVQAMFLWNVRKNGTLAAQWTVDLRKDPGAMYVGPPRRGASPSVTLTLEDTDVADFMAGKLSPEEAVTSGRLKITGNRLLLDKLHLLRPRTKK